MKRDKRLVNEALSAIKKMTRWQKFEKLVQVHRHNPVTGTTRPISLSKTIGRYNVSFEKAHELLKESRKNHRDSRLDYEMDKKLVLAGPQGELPQ